MLCKILVFRKIVIVDKASVGTLRKLGRMGRELASKNYPQRPLKWVRGGTDWRPDVADDAHVTALRTEFEYSNCSFNMSNATGGHCTLRPLQSRE